MICSFISEMCIDKVGRARPRLDHVKYHASHRVVKAYLQEARIGNIHAVCFI